MKLINKQKVLNIIQEEINVTLGIRTKVNRIDITKRIKVNDSEIEMDENAKLLKLQTLNELYSRILAEV